MSGSKREHVLTCARELFERDGFRATGVERILEHAGVAKMTLYNNFGSKDQLIAEVLRERSVAMVDRLAQFAATSGNDPYDQILGIFRGLGDWYEDDAFCGCMIQAAVSEFPDTDSAPAQAAREHMIRIKDVFEALCRAAALRDPETLARQLTLIASGSTCIARQTKCRTPADDAYRLAEVLLERAC